MKKLSLLALLALTGCGGINTNIAQQRINNAGNQEVAAWNKASAEGFATCPQGTDDKPVPRSKALDTHNCYTALIEKYVRPVAYSPMDLNQLILDNKKIAVAYKSGKLSRDEANLNRDQAFQAYIQRIDQKSRQELMYANQQDWALSQQLGQMSNSLNQPSPAITTPTHTNCNKIGNTVNCTTW